MITATLAQLAPRFKFRLNCPIISNIVFKMHYKLTVTFLMLFVIIVCATELVGHPIKCISEEKKDEFKAVIEKYCYIMATFTIERFYNETIVKDHTIPHPGVGADNKYDTRIYHKFYQWVPMVLIIQVILFYLPHYIWKKKEGGRIKMLVEGLENATLAREQEYKFKTGNIPSKDKVEKKLQVMTRDIILRLKINRTWSTWLVAMEVLNLIHVVFEIWAMNKFLNWQFLSIGPKILNFDWKSVMAPLERIFPKVTKCHFHKYGPSGSLQMYDAVCVMALNIINEKMYACMWFWFLVLFIVSFFAVVWRITSCLLFKTSTRFSQLMFMKANSAKLRSEDINRVVRGCSFGDWLFLYYLAKNMKSIVFQDLFTRVAEELRSGGILDENPHFQKKGRPSFADNIVSEKP